jgi:hypothetical protein
LARILEPVTAVLEKLSKRVDQIAAEPFGKVGKEPTPRDAARMPQNQDRLEPDNFLGDKAPEQNQFEEAVYSAPMNIRGQRIYGPAGHMDVPPHGQVRVRAAVGHDEGSCDCVDCKVAQDLRSRGFRRHQSKRSGAELALDQIKALHRAGAQKSAVIQSVLKADPSRALAMATTPTDKILEQWLGKRNAANNVRDFDTPVASWTPKTEYIRRLRERGYTLLEAEKIANGDAV